MCNTIYLSRTHTWRGRVCAEESRGPLHGAGARVAAPRWSPRFIANTSPAQTSLTSGRADGDTGPKDGGRRGPCC